MLNDFNWPGDEIKRIKNKIDTIRQRAPFTTADGHELASLKDELAVLEDSAPSQALVAMKPIEIVIEDNLEDEKPIRGFHHFSRAWYASRISPCDGAVDDIMFGMYYPNGGCDGEIKAAWYPLGRWQPTPHVGIFDDAWHLFVDFHDFFTDLANYKERMITPAFFCELLVKHGFRDLTQTEKSR